MTRTHVVWDFSNGPEGTVTETPFTAEEETAADLEEEAATAESQVVETPTAQQLLNQIADNVAKLRDMGINI